MRVAFYVRVSTERQQQTQTIEQQVAQLRGYVAASFPFRVWWVRDYGAQSPSAWARWMIARDPWNPTGGMTAWLLVSRDVAPA